MPALFECCDEALLFTNPFRLGGVPIRLGGVPIRLAFRLASLLMACPPRIARFVPWVAHVSTVHRWVGRPPMKFLSDVRA